MNKLQEIKDLINTKLSTTNQELEDAKEEVNKVVYSQHRTVESITLAANKVKLILKRVDSLNKLLDTISVLEQNNIINPKINNLIKQIESTLSKM